MKLVVSVALVTYNRLELLKKTIKSLASQTLLNFELIIVDNNSTDGTDEYCRSLSSELNFACHYIRNKSNLGLAKARNQALEKASGKYYTFIDDDDIWPEDFLEQCVKHAEKSNYNVFMTSTKYRVESGNLVFVKSGISGPLQGLVFSGYAPPVAGTFLLTSLANSVGGFSEDLTSCIDHDLWMKLAIKGESIDSIANAVSMPNYYSFSHSRMTTNVDSRIQGIETFLNKYKWFFEEKKSEKFFWVFRDRYFSRTYFKFAKVFLSNGEKRMFYRCLFKAIKYGGLKGKYLILLVMVSLGGVRGMQFAYTISNLKQNKTKPAV